MNLKQRFSGLAMHLMLRRPVFWISFTALSLVCAIFTVRNFSTAFPLVSLDLQMDRAEALGKARALAQRNDWPPDAFDQAAEFSTDQQLQNFIELEGGGKPELGRILRQKIFAPYAWRVRHFKEGDEHETQVRFTPEGEPYGFRVRLPDQEKGATKTAEEALQIAEETARAEWEIDFSRYLRVESSKDVLPGGRTDHSFVYERQDERLREGRYRLRLVVGGDRLTELTHFVQIPEAFTRRYEEMRSVNEAINDSSSVLVVGLYIFGFCGIGLFFMIRHRWVVWQPAVKWALLIAALMGLQQLNAWPLAWMGYDTALPASGFAIRLLMTAFGVFAALALLLTVSFVAAETLSRRAFPNHTQFWNLWSRPLSSSRMALGQTVSGYLLVAPFFAYEVVLYFFAQGRLGWWTPSDTLVNPDMFANYLPSLSAIAMAAQAGFWEECLFRAVPLATAALIGERFGKRGFFITLAMVFQAVVFAAGHAGYANQPAYARVVELIIPSFAFGFLYLLFGLLPAIVLHFAYDVAWMALPLFVSSSSRAYFEQTIVIIATLVPLWVILVNRLRSGSWTDVPHEALNGAWRPREIPHTQTPASVPALTAASIPSHVSRALPVAGLAGLAIWIVVAPFSTDAPAITIGREQAEQQAREALVRRGAEIDSSWSVLSRVEAQRGDVNRFVWQTAGRDVYEKLLGVYVFPPGWIVRFTRFEGDVAERAEEYRVYIDSDGTVFGVSHELPEAKSGENLSEDAARKVALGAIESAETNSQNGTPAPGAFQEVSAQATKRPARTDWAFVLKDTRDYGLPQGEPRVAVEIAGGEIASILRYVYIPEDWARNERARRNLPGILTIVCTIVVIAVMAAGAVIGAIHWSRRRTFSARAFLGVFGAVFVSGVVNAVNAWPAVASEASTAQPLELQVGIATLASIIFGIFTAAGLALVAGLVSGELRAPPAVPPRRTLLHGVCAGLAIAGAAALARMAAPSMSPQWGNLAPASTFVPFVAAALGPLTGYFTQTLLLLTVLYGLWRKPHASVVWMLAGLALTGSSIESIPLWLVSGIATGVALLIAYQLVFRHQPELVLIAAATLGILSATRDGIQGMYPAALAGSLAGTLLVAIAAWVWFRGTMEKQV